MRRHLWTLGLVSAISGIACSGDGGTPGDDAGNTQSGDSGNPTHHSDSGAPTPGDSGTLPGDDGGNPGKDSGPPINPSGKVVFVIPMENKPQTAIYGDTTDAPYINGTLMPAYAHTTNFTDELPALMSEPHYVWMESGANVFSDHTFATDSDSSSGNSTSSTAHLSAQLDAAKISWTSYQQGMTQGTCPINSTGVYAAKHNPFVFFQDVAGSPPSSSNKNCIAHHKPMTSLAGDLQNQAVSSFNFVTPDLCNDMHGDSSCSQGTGSAANIKAGDTWLKNNLPAIITYALAHNGYVFVTWDEGDSSNLISFIAISAHAIANHAGSVKYSHSSMLKSIEEILGVSVLSSVSAANDFADLFDKGYFP